MTAINAYFDNLAALTARTLETQQAGMEEAARRIADCFRNGGMLYTFGTGHGHLLALEIFYRAGGMARVCPILDEKLMLHISAAKSTHEERDEGWLPILLEKYPIKAGDVLISISNSGRNAVPVLLAKEARERGVDVTFDVYPYTASSTGLNVCLPADFFTHGPVKMCELLREPAVRAELKPRMEIQDGRLRHCGGWGGVLITDAPKNRDAEGLTVQEYADKLGRDAFEVYFDLVAANGGAAEAVYFSMCEEDLQRIVCDENATIGTDGVIRDFQTPTHPRSVASFPKAIRYFVRDKKLLTLEAMIRKMTGFPAERFGLKGKGIIADGMDADLVIFNPETITDRATYANSLQLCDGIERVLVGGITVYKDKQLTGLSAGKFIPHVKF